MAKLDIELQDTTCTDHVGSMAFRQNFDLGQIEVSGAPGLDALFQREAHLLSPHKVHRTKVASIKDLHSFVRLSSDTLIHKSDRDLWALKKEADGNYFIERLFDDNGEPLKG
jgi:hypothetical protein